MRAFFDALLSWTGLLIFALGVLLSAWVMRTVSAARSKVSG